MTHWRLVLLLVVTSFATVCLTNCRQNGSHQTAVPVRVAIDQFIGFAPIYVASDRGYFTQRGVSVEALPILDTAQRTASFASGRVDAICTTLDSLLLLASKGVDLVIVAAVDKSHGADGILAARTVRTATDLKGKTVAFQEGMPSHFLLLWYLLNNGLSPADIRAVNMNADDAGAAFTAGKVDAAVTWEPWLSRAKTDGKGKLLVSTADLPPVLVDVLAVRREVLTSRRAAVAALYSGWMDAIEYYKTSPDAALTIMSGGLKLSLDEVRQNAQTVEFADRAFNRGFFDKSAHDSAWSLATRAIGIWQTAGLMTPGQDSGRFLTDEIVRSESAPAK